MIITAILVAFIIYMHIHSAIINDAFLIAVSEVTAEEYVGTEPVVILKKGSRGLLPCKVDRDVGAIYWHRGTSQLTTATLLVAFQYYKGEWQKTGQGFLDGLFDIYDNFTLVIKEVTVEDNDYFFCEILDLDTGTTFTNQTSVEVFGKYHDSIKVNVNPREIIVQY